jgi:hypothetical protein
MFISGFRRAVQSALAALGRGWGLGGVCIQVSLRDMQNI